MNYVRASDLSKIKAMITATGLKKSHIADQIGISKVYLSYVLNGKKPLSANVKEKLFTYFDMN